MDVRVATALDRTARLINADFFGGALDSEEIVAHLIDTSVRVVADPCDLASTAGQHALTTLVLHLSMSGIGVDLEVAATPLLGHQPPLLGVELRSALEQHVRHNTPWVRLNSGVTPLVTFRLGSSRGDRRGDILVCGDATGCRVGPSGLIAASRWAGDWPIGAIAAGIAAAAEALRYAIVNIARRAGHRVPAVITPGTSITAVDLGPQPTSTTNLGELTIISAGAVTQAAMYTLLRIPDVHGSASVYDDDVFETSNLNRYPLLVAEDLGRRKATQLGRWSNGLIVEGVQERYKGGDTTGVAHMLIGADDIAVRWAAQRDLPRWLGIGATSHLFAEVSSHSADSPCAGCVHDHEDDPPAVIPTISVISGWAGVVMASELLHDVGGASTAGRMAWSFPLGLSGRSGHRFIPIPPNAQCPVDCTASRGVLRSA